MLSTKDIPATGGSGKISKTIKPGNITAKITSIDLKPLASNPSALYLIMNLETEPIEGDFEGFLYDSKKPELGRALGQVGRVKYSQYPYKDMVTKSGYPVARDRQILRDVAILAETLGVRDLLDDIQAKDIETFVAQASKVLANGTFLKWCIGGSAYIKDDGNKNFDLYLPKYNKDVKTVNFAKIENQDNVTVFKQEVHIDDKTADQPKEEKTSEWGGKESTPAAGWSPTGFEM